MEANLKACLASLSLLLVSSAAHAASVQLEAFAIASAAAVDPGSPDCTAGSSPGIECVRMNTSLGIRKSDPTSRSVATPKMHYEFRANNNTGLVPNFAFEGDARATASLGSLHAFADVLIVGFGPTPSSTFRPPDGAGARARLTVTDTMQVRSTTLAQGTSVTLNTLFQVTGHGAGVLDLTITAFRVVNGSASAVTLFNDRSAASIGIGQALTDIEGSFSAKIGETLRIVYSLEASAQQFTSGWNAAATLNGRANTSDYDHTANLFFGVAGGNPAVQLVGDSGYNYVMPAAVPVPAGLWLITPALGALVMRSRNRGVTRRATSTES